MDNTFSLEQTSKTGNHDFHLLFRQQRLDLFGRFMEIEYVNPELRRDQIAKEVSCSKGTLKPYRHDNYMLSHYGVSLNSHKEDNSFQIQKLFVI